MNTNFGDLPDEIKFTIFTLTTPRDVCSLRQTCKGFKDVLNGEVIDEWIVLRKSYPYEHGDRKVDQWNRFLIGCYDQVTEMWKEFIIENNALRNQCTGLITNKLIPPTYFSGAYFEDNSPIKAIHAGIDGLIKIVQDYAQNNLKKIPNYENLYIIDERLAYLSDNVLKVGMNIDTRALIFTFKRTFKPFTIISGYNVLENFDVCSA